jgi:CBS domain-containing protein
MSAPPPNHLLREVPILGLTEPVSDAISKILATGVPALPVADDSGAIYGIFGEREFIEALFPGYVSTLASASFVPRSIESVIEKRAGCAVEPIREHVTTDHVEVDAGFSDVQLAEIFLHHRVLIVPVLDDGAIVGVITRAGFFAALSERFLEQA